MYKDTVFIKDLSATAIIGKDAWGRPSPQPLGVSINLATDFLASSETDNLKYSLNYAVISRAVSEYLRGKEQNQHNFGSLATVSSSLTEVLKGATPAEVDYDLKIVVESKKSEIRADSVRFIGEVHKSGEPMSSQYQVSGLRLLTIIGVFTFERLQRQIVELDIAIDVKTGAKTNATNIHSIIEAVVEYVENSNFKTVEALVSKVGQVVHQVSGSEVSNVDVKVTKPNAIPYTEGVGVRTSLKAHEVTSMEPVDLSASQSLNSTNNGAGFNLFVDETDAQIDSSKPHTAYIAFGSNVGNQVENINLAIDLLKQNHDVTVISTSSLYISKPMYVKEQSDFYNGCLKVSLPASMTPQDLLDALKQIEYEELQRVKQIENGPRSIDLDIILYDNVVVTLEKLNIPHISMLERTFVLKPLCELIPPDFTHPVSTEPIHNHLKQLLKATDNQEHQESSVLVQVIPFARKPRSTRLSFDQTDFTTLTMVMGVLNITPDSFSDGGSNLFESTSEEICIRALKLIEDGATILDIGGVSTRPGAPEPTETEELKRILPVVQAIRNSTNQTLADVLISVDTYRSNVAEQCLLAGADIINDISMGAMSNDKMFEIVAKYNCPYIMNHTRGTPKTMSGLTTYKPLDNEDVAEYSIDSRVGKLGHEDLSEDAKNLLNGISHELSFQIEKAFAVGVKKWQIILDPGIGFAKNTLQNLMILKNASFFKFYCTENYQTGSYISFNGMSTLLGPSRKKFLGVISKEEVPHKRIISTAAAIMACIEQKGDIVRVHDVAEIKKVCLTGDAIYKQIY